MSRAYVARRADSTLLEQLSSIAPANPFATAPYFEAKRKTGYQPWILGQVSDQGVLLRGCGAFLRSGRLNTIVEIVSLPQVQEDSPFWDYLREFCRRERVTRLSLQTFGSPGGVQIPPFLYESSRRIRCELSVDLASDLNAIMDPHHRRRVRKAKEGGLELKRSTAVDDLKCHYLAMGASMERRRSRGERVSDAGREAADVALLSSGAAELFQSVRGGEVLSSALVLQSKEGGYLFTTGTSLDGMSVGASHFLIHRIAATLKAEGKLAFALGGAEEGSGLAEFKLRFGARPTYMPEVNCYVGPRWKQHLGSMLSIVESVVARVR